MDNTKIGYIICESDTTEELFPINIINEEEVDIQATEEHYAYKDKKLIAEGVLQTADIINRNGRIYGGDELFPQLESERIIQLLDHKQLLGEMGHPLSTELSRQQTIDEKNSCVRYLKLWRDNNHVMGRYKGTNNEYGKTFDMDLREGCIPEFSLRALGSLERTSRGNEVKNLKLITYDKVIFQSDRDAYMRKIISENSILEEDNTIRKPSITQDIFVPFDNEAVRKYIMEESMNLKSIKDSFDIFYDSIRLLNNGKVQMQDKCGSTLIINLESYIQKEIMDYANNSIIF